MQVLVNPSDEPHFNLLSAVSNSEGLQVCSCTRVRFQVQ